MYRVVAEATYRLTQWLTLTASYQFDFQHGRLGGAPGDNEIRHNVVLLELAISYPVRLD